MFLIRNDGLSFRKGAREGMFRKKNVEAESQRKERRLFLAPGNRIKVYSSSRKHNFTHVLYFFHTLAIILVNRRKQKRDSLHGLNV